MRKQFVEHHYIHMQKLSIIDYFFFRCLIWESLKGILELQPRKTQYQGLHLALHFIYFFGQIACSYDIAFKKKQKLHVNSLIISLLLLSAFHPVLFFGGIQSFWCCILCEYKRNSCFVHLNSVFVFIIDLFVTILFNCCKRETTKGTKIQTRSIFTEQDGKLFSWKGGTLWRKTPVMFFLPCVNVIGGLGGGKFQFPNSGLRKFYKVGSNI